MKTTGTTIKLGIVWLVLSAGCGPGNLSALRA